jgi:hypothetical protein
MGHARRSGFAVGPSVQQLDCGRTVHSAMKDRRETPSMGMFFVAWLILAASAAPVGRLFDLRNLQRGSLAVSIVSQNGDYVVTAADSRAVDAVDGRHKDTTCKLIALGGDTLFFTTGTISFTTSDGASWDAVNLARTVYVQSKKRDALSLMDTWSNKTQRTFRSQSQANLKILSDKNGGLVLGGFVNFKEDGNPLIRTRVIQYFSTEPHVRSADDAPSPPFGHGTAAGDATGLVVEFFDAKSRRAIQAAGVADVVRHMGIDAQTDAKIARQAIQFAVHYGTEEDQRKIGGEIDVAILRKPGKVEWVKRKSNCYRQDQP